MLEYGGKGDLVCLELMWKWVCAELDLLRLGTGVLIVVCPTEDGVGQSALFHARQGTAKSEVNLHNPHSASTRR